MRKYETREEDLDRRVWGAARRRERALRSVWLLRITEKDDALGCWAPEPWHKEEAERDGPATGAREVPAGCEEIPAALGRPPPTVEGPRAVVTITKAARGKPRDAAQKLAGARRKVAAVVERKKTRLARGRERARQLVQAAARRQPEMRTSVRRWHRLDAARRRASDPVGGGESACTCR